MLVCRLQYSICEQLRTCHETRCLSPPSKGPMPPFWPRPLPFFFLATPFLLMWPPSRALIGTAVGKVPSASRLLQVLRRGRFSMRKILRERATRATDENDQLGKVIVIAGPTASGKSAIALLLCKRLGGEIVSCDSVQVYRDLHIGANKPSIEERHQVKHHLIDIASLDQTFTAGDFVRRAQEAVNDILSRGRVPVVVGGTMMYVQWLVHGTPDAPKKNPAVAETVAAELLPFQERGDWDGALQILSAVNETRAKSICPNDWYRLSRSLEVIRGVGSVADVYTGVRKPLANKYDLRPFFVVGDRERLFRRIDRRCEEMLERGLLVETAELLVEGRLDPASPAGRAIGYRQAIDFLSQEAGICASGGEGDSERGIHGMQGAVDAKNRFLEFYGGFATKTRQYAADQMKWFRSPKGRDFMWQVWDLGGAGAPDQAGGGSHSHPWGTATSATGRVSWAGDGRSREDVADSIAECFEMSREAFDEELGGEHQGSLRTENGRRARDMKRYVPAVTEVHLGHEPSLARLVLQAEQLSTRLRETRSVRSMDDSTRTGEERQGWTSANR